ncbi:hypothetical protein ACW0KB_02575 [Virgibacillus salarius]
MFLPQGYDLMALYQSDNYWQSIPHLLILAFLEVGMLLPVIMLDTIGNENQNTIFGSE